ncbi:hypothetical protein MVEN_00680100 [Mycena venus]|uniref:SnoaL-like domain-containing protein n=1 Tax=Mycena venus TaxID=2733690 RepID=A0A8H6YI71_9AGAR|nr:hypothetical protein MVEN_00680100 [Mycena venus]
MSDTHTQAKQLVNTHAFLNNFSACDWDAAADLLSPEFKHQFLPSSILHADGKETRGKEEWLELMKHYFKTCFERMTVLPPMDVVQGKDVVVFHFKSDGVSKSGKVPYKNEYIAILRFDGEKIVGMKEFMDTKCALDFGAALAAE